MTGARLGGWNWLRRVVARAGAGRLAAFVVPDAAIARMAGLDVQAAGLEVVSTPRHANVLLVVGPLPAGLIRAATVAYAQMPRPRAVVALGTPALDGLQADVHAPLDQDGITASVAQAREWFAAHAFATEVTEFDVAAIRTRTEYTCPMHPEIVRDGPGQCPICGMNLVPREAAGEAESGGMASMAPQAGAPATNVHAGHAMPPVVNKAQAGSYTCPMHPEIVRDEPGQCPICGMNLVPVEDTANAATKNGDSVSTSHEPQYTCPMHPEIVQNGPGSCPICGMNLVPSPSEHGASTHGDDGDEPPNMEYTCPMHPEIAQREAGSCPICGMTLVPAQSPEQADHSNHSAPHESASVEYTCPMHPEIVRSEPGSCPICGMHLVPRDAPAQASNKPATPAEPAVGAAMAAVDSSHSMDHANHTSRGAMATAQVSHGGAQAIDNADGAPAMNHSGHQMAAMNGVHDMGGTMDHSSHDMSMMGHSGHGSGFMSMIAITKDLPRSPDGLPMEWLDAPFGPLFPALPGGLRLTLTLDGDRIATASAELGATQRDLDQSWRGSVDLLPGRLSDLDRLAPGAYAALAHCLLPASAAREQARVGALERARATSHLAWLASFSALLGIRWLTERAAALQLSLVRATAVSEVISMRAAVQNMLRGVARIPLLERRLGGIGSISHAEHRQLRGPVARAAGLVVDARIGDPAYMALGFSPVVLAGNDAFARLRVRLREIEQSLALIEAAGVWDIDMPDGVDLVASHQAVTLEMPRGPATLHVTIEGHDVTRLHIDSPSRGLADLVPTVAEDAELANALIAVASLDISPWEIDQ